MQQQSDLQEISKLNFEFETLPVTGALKEYETVFRRHFQNVETAFLKFTWPDDQRKFLMPLFSDSFNSEYLTEFLTYFFRNPALLKTPLEAVGIGVGFRVQTPFQKIEPQQMASTFASVLRNSGSYGASDIDEATAQALGQRIYHEVFGEERDQLSFFFNKFGSWSSLYTDWGMMATFLVFNPADATMMVLHMGGDDG